MTTSKTSTSTTATSSITKSSSASETATTIKKLLKQQQDKHSDAYFNEQSDAARLDELRRIFSKIQTTSELQLTGSTSSSATATETATATATTKKNKVQAKWNAWLKNQHSTFIMQLSNAVKDERKSALRTFMGVIASSPIIIDEGSNSNKKQQQQSSKSNQVILHRVNEHLVYKLVTALIKPNNEDGIVAEHMLEMLDVEFMSRYRDIQYLILVNIKLVAQELYNDAESKQKKNVGMTDDDDDDDDDDDRNGDEIIGIYAENLSRILLKIQLAIDQSDLNPTDVKPKDGTCANYLFLPAKWSNIEQVSDDDDDDQKDDSSVDDTSDEEEDSHNENNQHKRKTKDQTQIKPKNKVKLPPYQSIGQHRAAIQQATLNILKIQTLPPRSLKSILQALPSQILPNSTNPLRFADFCTFAYEVGGITSLLALNSLFILMTQHGLEYKQFYLSLYNLIESKVFYAKYRTRFFKLLVKCLCGNQMLPAYLVAAFCKKLCRCALSAPPSGALFILALVSNLIRKHEECACIIHRNGTKMDDPYDVDQKDPVKSKAIESSLWELNALEQHYHPAVSSMAKGCGTEDSKTLMHDLDSFLLHTYKSLFDQERKRAGNKRRSTIPLTFHEPKSLFVEGDMFDGIFDFPMKKIKG